MLVSFARACRDLDWTLFFLVAPSYLCQDSFCLAAFHLVHCMRAGPGDTDIKDRFICCLKSEKPLGDRFNCRGSNHSRLSGSVQGPPREKPRGGNYQHIGRANWNLFLFVSFTLGVIRFSLIGRVSQTNPSLIFLITSFCPHIHEKGKRNEKYLCLVLVHEITRDRC